MQLFLQQCFWLELTPQDKNPKLSPTKQILIGSEEVID